jgi:dolichyl-phosphate beta-glucosyltransferase
MQQPVISLIFPAYNEAQTIVNTVNEAKDYFESNNLTFEIIVSADGNDGTRELVAKMGQADARIKVIGSEERGGKGLGIRRTLPLVTGKYVGFADADNKTPITEFDKMLPLLEEDHDLVIGSRAIEGAKIERKQPWFRQIGSKGFAIFMHLVVGLPGIKDTQCGFKFFQHDVFVDLFTHQHIDGYMYDVEILYLARQRKYDIEQVPVRWSDDGDSRLQLLSGNIRNVIDIFRIRFDAATYKKAMTVVANHNHGNAD